MKTLTLIFLLGFTVSFAIADENSSESLRPSVHAVLNTKRTSTYLKRVDDIKKLPRQLTEGEGIALLNFLALDPELDTTLTIEELATVKNDVTGRLCADRRFTEDLAQRLIAMSSQEHLGSTWNCYCIQYFTKVYPVVMDSTKALLLETYRGALALPNHPKSGTALISMRNVSEICPEITTGRISAAAWALYRTDSALTMNKLTAFQILGDLGDYRIVRESRAILSDTTRIDAHYRMASLAILGKHGIAKDVPLLETYSKHADLRLRTAATRNLKTLKKRLVEHE